MVLSLLTHCFPALVCCFLNRVHDGCSFLKCPCNDDCMAVSKCYFKASEEAPSPFFQAHFHFSYKYNIHVCTVLDSFLHLPLQKNIARLCPCVFTASLPGKWNMQFPGRGLYVCLGLRGTLHRLIVGDSACHFVWHRWWQWAPRECCYLVLAVQSAVTSLVLVKALRNLLAFCDMNLWDWFPHQRGR